VDESRAILDDSYLTVDDVDGLLKVNRQTVRNYIDRGSCRPFASGRGVSGSADRRLKRSSLPAIRAAG
jgi:hypothetical protein